MRLGYSVFDLRKDQSTDVFLPGHLRTIFDALQVNCVIDVGANHGQFASMIRRAGYRGVIISVEPQMESYATLAAAARTDPLWTALNIALGERDEDATLNVLAASDLNSLLRPSANMVLATRDSDVRETQQVQVRRLDSIFEALVHEVEAPRVFLKLDTQGYDLHVLRGADQSLGKIVGLQSELSVIPLYEGTADYIHALSVYRELGFEPTGIFPVAYDRATRHVLEFDTVLTRRK